MGGTKTRDFLNHKIDQYVKYSDFFINEHHRRIFKRTLPKIYAWVFEDQGADQQAVSKEFATTIYFTALKETLVGIGFVPGAKPTDLALIPMRGSGQQVLKTIGPQISASIVGHGYVWLIRAARAR